MGIDFFPAQLADLIGPLAGEDQQSYNVAIVAIPERVPDYSKLGVRQGAIAAPLLSLFGGR